MRRLAALALLVLAACQPEAEALPRPSMTATEKADCTAKGGQIGIAGLLGGEFCVKRAPDVGKSCTKASDCAGDCLSASRTCAPTLNPFGCRDYLDETGQPQSICVD